MLNQEQKEIWQELRDIWKNSSHFEISKLMLELKSKVSQFEKESIKRDITKINASISQFEKDSITKDTAKIKASIKKIMHLFRVSPTFVRKYTLRDTKSK
jgi:hypothetical protein